MSYFSKCLTVLMITGCYSVHSATSNAKLKELALSMVPKARLLEKDGRDLVLKTEAGTKISLEFFRDGTLEEAKGDNLGHGDELEPGQGLISLGSAAHVLTKAGHKISGDWSLEKDSTYGWVYELEGKLKNHKMSYLVNAKNGNIIKAED